MTEKPLSAQAAKPLRAPANPKKIAIFTSCATNYIPKARVLAASVKQFHDDIDVYLLAVDELPANFSVENEQFDAVVEAESLEIPNYKSWIFGHTIVEACTAVKPFMLKHLLAQGYEKAFYFDPDIALFSPLTNVLDGFKNGSILLTPHLCKPEKTEQAIADNELSALKHGVFNFGFVGVKNDEIGVSYADWWAKRCYQACYDAIARGVFTDQKWNDLVPAFFDKVNILKDPTLNVATWNYDQRDVQGNSESGFTVDGQPLTFHHFTGYDSGAHHAMLAKYGKNMPATSELSQWYEDRCQHFAQTDLSAIKWKYGAYDNGEVIAKHHRQLYRERKDLQASFPSPFAVAQQAEAGGKAQSYYAWLKQEDLLTHRPAMPNNHRSFSQFVTDTQHELEGYIARTDRLAGWQKKAALTASDALFHILKMPLSSAKPKAKAA